jgi:hypothetical protein
MSYIREKEIKGNKYYYEQRSVRVGDKVKTEHIRYVGSKTNNYHNELGTTSYNDKAIKQYGTTENENETGFILNNGMMLDFSGRNEAQGYKNNKPEKNSPDYLKNQRNTDHRDIYKILPEKERESRYDAIKEYGEKTGSIRFTKTSTDNDINIECFKKPTPSQMTRIKSIQQKNKGKIYADMTYKKQEGNTKSVYGGNSKEYNNYNEFERDVNNE